MSTRIFLTIFLLIVLACVCYSADTQNPSENNPVGNTANPTRNGNHDDDDHRGNDDDDDDDRRARPCNNNRPRTNGHGNGNADCKEPIKLVVDTDMGLDDITAIGILLAHSTDRQYIRSNSQKVKILGMVTDDGIARIANGTSNLLRILQRVGRSDIKVYQGEVLVNMSQGHIIKPFSERFRPFHSLLPGIEMPPQVNFPEAESAAEYLVRVSREHPGFTLFSLGVLSNIAAAMELDPTFPSRVGRLVMMAGAVYAPGNARPNPNVSYVAEWNLYVDQWATAKVFNSGQFSGKTDIAPLDVTNHWFYLNASKAFENAPYTEVGSFIKNAVQLGVNNSNIYLYDPCAAELLLRPDLMTTQLIPIAAIPSGYNASALYVADPRQTTAFTWARVALNLDQVATMEWYKCTIAGTCTR